MRPFTVLLLLAFLAGCGNDDGAGVRNVDGTQAATGSGACCGPEDGIGAGLSRLVRAIRADERAVLTVSIVADVEGVADVAVSLPRVVGRAGVLATLTPPLTADERAALRRSAEIVAAAAHPLAAP